MESGGRERGISEAWMESGGMERGIKGREGGLGGEKEWRQERRVERRAK